MVDNIRTSLGKRGKLKRTRHMDFTLPVDKPTMTEAFSTEHAHENYATIEGLVSSHSMDSLIRVSRALQ
jgi:hypothetical protein